MRRIALGVAIMAGLLLGTMPGSAQALSVSADIPVTYTFAESGIASDSPSGFLLGVSLPLLMNFGYEHYNVTGSTSVPASTSYSYQVDMLDLYLDIPFPVANLVLGAGVGQGSFDAASAPGTIGKATLYQLYFNVGIPFAGIFDAHVGYHQIFGEADIALSNKLNLDAGMATVGVKVGF